jgi:hypothetical protein
MDTKIYFLDPDNLLYQQESNFIFGRQYEPFVIPCKPNTPQVKVELVKEDGEVMQITEPKLGYTLNFSDPQSIFINCTALVNNTSTDLYQIHVEIFESRCYFSVFFAHFNKSFITSIITIIITIIIHIKPQYILSCVKV